MENEPLSPELEAALALINAERTLEIQPVSDAMGAVGAAIDAIDLRLFPGGLNVSLLQLQQQVESIRASLKRDYGTTYVSKYTGT